MSMKLACVVATPDIGQAFGALLTGTFEEKLAKARALGYTGVELMLCNPAALHAQDIRASLAKHGLEVPQIVTGAVFRLEGLALVHPDPAVCVKAMSRAQGIVRFASTLGRDVNVNLGLLRGRIDWLEPADRAGARARFITAFQTLADYAAPYHVRITLEPANRYEADFVHSARDGMEVVAEVGRSNFGLMLDTFHMNIEDRSIEGGLREARAVLWHVHIADSNRLPPGQGHLDFASIVATLDEMGYAGYLSGEMLPLPDPDSAAQLTVEHMKRWCSPDLRTSAPETSAGHIWEEPGTIQSSRLAC